MGSAHETNAYKNFDIFSTNNHGLAFLLFFSAPGLLMTNEHPKAFFAARYSFSFLPYEQVATRYSAIEAP